MAQMIERSMVGFVVGILMGLLVMLSISQSQTLLIPNKEAGNAEDCAAFLPEPEDRQLQRNAEEAPKKSLFRSIAPMFFPIHEITGKIDFPERIKSVAIDIGARESDYLTAMEKEDDNSVALIMFDPLPLSFLPLQERVAKFSLRNAEHRALDGNHSDRVFAIHAAVAEEEGTAQFNVAAPACGSLLKTTEDGAIAQFCAKSSGKRTVMIFTLKDVLDLLPDHLESIHIKIDAEGADLSVLKGAGSSIKRASSVVIECQDLEPTDKRVLRDGSCLYREAAKYMCDSQGFCNNEFVVSGAKNIMGNVFFVPSTNTAVAVPPYYMNPHIQFKEFYGKLATRRNVTNA